MGRAHEVRAASMAKTAAIRSKQNAKYAVLIYKAAKSGVPDPDLNQALKKEIEKAKKAQIPADVIKRSIDKAKGGQGEAYEEIRYEGFGPNNSMFIVDCVTDNLNRTYTTIRTIFSRTGCKLGVSGSVSHMFTNQAFISFEGMTDEETLDLLVSNDCDVSDIQYEDGVVTIYAPSGEYNKIHDALTANNPDMEFIDDEITYIPQIYVTLEDESDINHFKKLYAALDECEDVQKVYHNVQGVELDEEE
jgi:YebC/PmpR family DNA-binding regulatory protein